MTASPLELVCPAGSLAALKTAVDNGADCVYTGFRDDTNARNFPGLNFDEATLRQAVDYAHARGKQVFTALNTYPQAGGMGRWRSSLDRAMAAGVDALIIADLGLLQYARRHYPDARLHLSVQGSATTAGALEFYYQQFGIARAVLPRVLSLGQIAAVLRQTPVQIEVFGFGSLCVMVEGRCLLSSYATGDSPNNHGACSPAPAVRWDHTAAGLETRLNGVLIDRFGDGEKAGYPTLCKGRFKVHDDTYYAIEEPTSLNTLELLPQLIGMGVKAIKIEGRQRSPAYIATVARTWRQAIDHALSDRERYIVRSDWTTDLDRLSEGSQHTLGAYHRPWK